MNLLGSANAVRLVRQSEFHSSSLAESFARFAGKIDGIDDPLERQSLISAFMANPVSQLLSHQLIDAESAGQHGPFHRNPVFYLTKEEADKRHHEQVRQRELHALKSRAKQRSTPKAAHPEPKITIKPITVSAPRLKGRKHSEGVRETSS
jgi:hypothetical protein